MPTIAKTPANILPASRSLNAKTRSGGYKKFRFRAEYQTVVSTAGSGLITLRAAVGQSLNELVCILSLALEDTRHQG